jgi:hypothetical protein
MGNYSEYKQVYNEQLTCQGYAQCSTAVDAASPAANLFQKNMVAISSVCEWQ